MKDFYYEFPVKTDDFKTVDALIRDCNIEDCHQFLFNIAVGDISENLQKKIDDEVIRSKMEYVQKYPDRTWTSMREDFIEFEFLDLIITVSTDGIRYSVDGLFRDMDDEKIVEADFRIPVNLPEYDEQVKAMFHKFIDRVFF